MPTDIHTLPVTPTHHHTQPSPLPIHRFFNSSYEKPSTSGARTVRLLHVESASYAVVLWREFWQRTVTPVRGGKKLAVQLGGVF